MALQRGFDGVRHMAGQGAAASTSYGDWLSRKRSLLRGGVGTLYTDRETKTKRQGFSGLPGFRATF